MFTPQFKITIAILLFVLAFGVLLMNQLFLQKDMNMLQQRTPVIEQVVVTPTVIPTATPTAALKYTPKVVAPVKPVVTPTLK